MSTVFLIAQPSVRRNGEFPDLTPLSDHGDLVVLIETGIYPSNNPMAAAALVSKRLETFDCENDCIAWAGGDTLAAILVGISLSDLDVPYFYYLRYDRHKDPSGQRLNTGYYSRVRVDLGEMPVLSPRELSDVS